MQFPDGSVLIKCVFVLIYFVALVSSKHESFHPRTHADLESQKLGKLTIINKPITFYIHGDAVALSVCDNIYAFCISGQDMWLNAKKNTIHF